MAALNGMSLLADRNVGEKVGIQRWFGKNALMPGALETLAHSPYERQIIGIRVTRDCFGKTGSQLILRDQIYR